MADNSPIEEKHDFFAGTDHSVKVLVRQRDKRTPQAMTGWALTWELKDSANGTVRATKTTGAGEITIADGRGTNDMATVSVSDGDTEGIVPSGQPSKVLYHQLRRTDGGSEVLLAFGSVYLQATGN